MMSPEKENTGRPKTHAESLNDSILHFESFIQGRGSYVKALETAIEALKKENQGFAPNTEELRTSIDELVAMHRLSNTISAATDPEGIVGTLIELTKQVIPVIDSNIFLFESGEVKLRPLSSRSSSRLVDEAQEQVEAGILDWVMSENKTVIIPDLAYLGMTGTTRNFVIVPLLIRNTGLGIYMIHTGKPQAEFSNQDIQLLSVLANQAAVGVENWRTFNQLVKVNADLKASQAQMIQAAKLAAIGELAASIVHEIKNPLQILMMHLEMVEKGKELPNWIELLGQQVKRLSEIAGRLMNFARNVNDDGTMEAVNVNRAIEMVIAMVGHDFKSSNIEIILSLQEEMVSIIGNSNYLQQVFLNLFINARDAMSNGGTLTVSSESDAESVIVKVQDTGVGIDQANLDRVFAAFFTTKEAGKGTGLGLSVCSKIVDQHGGTIQVESEIDRGTTFVIRFPIRRKLK